MNSQQQQLLQLLQIKSLSLHTEFLHVQPDFIQLSVATINTEQPQSALLPDIVPGLNCTSPFTLQPVKSMLDKPLSPEEQRLASDIERALALMTSALCWRCTATDTQVRLTDHELFTPAVAQLTDPQLKQQLWQLLTSWQNQHEPN